jgi:hypothetical protein
MIILGIVISPSRRCLRFGATSPFLAQRFAGGAFAAFVRIGG